MDTKKGNKHKIHSERNEDNPCLTSKESYLRTQACTCTWTHRKRERERGEGGGRERKHNE